jgi:hypothetical protein
VGCQDSDSATCCVRKPWPAALRHHRHRVWAGQAGRRAGGQAGRQAGASHRRGLPRPRPPAEQGSRSARPPPCACAPPHLVRRDQGGGGGGGGGGGIAQLSRWQGLGRAVLPVGGEGGGRGKGGGLHSHHIHTPIEPKERSLSSAMGGSARAWRRPHTAAPTPPPSEWPWNSTWRASTPGWRSSHSSLRMRSVTSHPAPGGLGRGAVLTQPRRRAPARRRGGPRCPRHPPHGS